jgi:CelD/BcsL family acetyltransferase involved in cellulose biosynthesis
MGLGLHDKDGLMRQLITAAERKLMLCYVLYHGVEPLAFQLGYRFQGVYYAYKQGYDPAWSDHSVGNILHCAIVRDLIECQDDIRSMDLLFGDTPNKKRFSNAAREEGSFYLFPRSIWRGTAFAFFTAINTLSRISGRMLHSLGLRKSAGQLIRRINMGRRLL